MTTGKNLRYNSPHEIKVSFADEDMFSKGAGELNMFDVNNPDTGLFDTIDGEMIQLAGSELLIFRYTRDENYDTVYEEHPGKVIYHKPVQVFGHYDPRPVAGDVIRPRFQNLYYELFEVQEDSFESYGVYHLVCAAKLLRDAETLLGNQYIT